MTVSNKLLSLFGWQNKAGPRITRNNADELVGGGGGTTASRFYNDAMKLPYERRRRYDTFDEMDEIDDVVSILDAYSEDSTQDSIEHKSSVWVEASDAKVKKECEELFKRLNVDEFTDSIARDVAKYGDDFAILNIEGNEIVNWNWADPRDIERVEHVNGTLLGFENSSDLKSLRQKVSSAGSGSETIKFAYKPWEVVHFRNYKTKRRRNEKFRNIYGTSLLEGSERVTKQLRLVTDMLVIHRLANSLDRIKYGIYVGQAPTEEEIMILKRWKSIFKKKSYIDPTNNRYDGRFDPSSWSEDIYWPVRENGESTADVIPGRPNVGDIVDVEFFDNRFFGSMRAPKGYFGREGEINAKATLSSQDMKWGRSCMSIQKAIRTGLVRLCKIQLALKGIDPGKNFTVAMVSPSSLEELTRLDALNLKIDAAERLATLGETLKFNQDKWRNHILRGVLGMSEKDIKLYTSPDKEGSDTDADDGEDEEILDRDTLSEFIGKLVPSISAISEQVRSSELPNAANEKFSFELRSLHPIPEETEPEVIDDDEE